MSAILINFVLAFWCYPLSYYYYYYHYYYYYYNYYYYYYYYLISELFTHGIG